MNIRGAILLIGLGAPAVALLAFGPRGQIDIPQGRTVIRYWEKWTGVEEQAMRRIVDRFNTTVGADANLWVDYCSISSIDQRLLIATAGGDPPDVAGLYDLAVSQFAEQGALMELSALADEAGIDAHAFKPIWWDMGIYGGKLYGLPSAPYTVALYYNKRLFRDAGLDPDRPPETLAELGEFSKRLTRYDANGKTTQLGFTVSPAMLGWWHWIWPCFFDADLWDGHDFHLNTPQAAAAMKWIAESRAELGLARVIAFESTSGAIEGPQNPFLSERLAMVFQGPWVSNWTQKYAPTLDYGVAPFPSVSRERRNAFASADVFVIPRGSPHPREAMVFLKFVMRQDVMEELCRAHCKVSPFRKPAPDFFATHPNPHIRVFDKLADSPHVFGQPKMPTFREASMEMLHMLDSTLQGVRQPAEALEAAQSRIDAIVTQHRAMNAKRHAGQGQLAE